MSQWTLSTITREPDPAAGRKSRRSNSYREITSRLHEFAASEHDRESWTRAFWALFPTDEAAFIAVVRSPGISASVDLEFHPVSTVRPAYGGVPADRIHRLLLSGNAAARLDHLYGAEQRTIGEGSLARFRRDLEAWRCEYHLACSVCTLRLPEPPAPFTWEGSRGGVIITQEVGGWHAPERLTFRLWHRGLGYMPAAE
jgi:hypothetical protein